MLPKKHRLLEKYDFRRVKRLGQAYHSPFFVAVVAPAKKKTDLRFGFVVSTKIDKRAVTRNRVKRLFREGVKAILPKLKSGFDVVIIAKEKSKGKTYEEISLKLNKVLSKVPLLGSRLGKEILSQR